MRLLYPGAICFLFGLVVTACKPRQAASSGQPPEAKSAKFLIRQLERQYTSFSWFAAKLKMNLDDSERSVSFTTSLRMQHDSLIWMSFQKLGQEGARALITPSRFALIDRQNNEYFERPYRYLSDSLRLPVQFTDLEDLLIGRFNPESFGQRWESNVQDTLYRLSAINADVRCVLLLDRGYQLRRIAFYSAEGIFTLDLNDYETLPTGQRLSRERLLVVQPTDAYDAPVQVAFSVNKITFDEPQSVSFDPPEHYKKR